MSFKSKVDYFGLAKEGAVVVVSANEGKSAQTVEAAGQDGSIVASEVFGETMAPSCDYKLKAAMEFTAQAPLKIGDVMTVDEKKFVRTNLSISTGAGSEPTVSASGEQVNDDAVTGCYFAIPAFKLLTKHHAQILFSAFELTGDGCHLTGANYTLSANLAKATKEGVCLAFDVTNGRIEAKVTVKQCGTAAPTLTPGDGWKITAPLTESNPDSDYPTFTATLVKYLAKSDAAETP